MRSPAGRVTSGAEWRASSTVAGSRVKPSSSSSRTARSSRNGSSSKTDADTARTTRASRSARPPCGSQGSPPPTGIAIALRVKSLVPRSSSIVPGRGVKSTVCSSPSTTTLQAP